MTRVSPFALTIGALVVSALAASAQSHVPVRPAAQPGQVIHVTVTQDVVLRTGERPEEPGPAQLQNANVLTFTQTNGKPDAEGKLDAQVVIERLSLSESMGGRPRSVPETDGIKGRTLLASFDRTGKLLGIKLPPDIANNLQLRLTQLLAGSYSTLNFLPNEELAVGKDSTSTAQLPMRLPGDVGQKPLEARTNVTLRSVEKTPAGRIAHLQQTSDVATSTSQVTVTGAGTIEVNLDRGFVAAADTEWKISGSMPGKEGGVATPFAGTIRIRVSAN